MVELIGHRMGNTEAGIEAFPAAADSVELDVHRHRGELVVRHAKRVWFTSRLWDRWFLLPPDTPVVLFDDMLASLGQGVGLWVDCKGVSRRLPRQVAEAVADRGPVTVSSKAWWVLSELEGNSQIRTIRSAGNRFELLLLRYLPSAVAVNGTVVHSRLLDAETVVELHRRHGPVFSWSISDLRAARRLISWGVDGLIIDEPSLLVALAKPNVEGDDAGGHDPGEGKPETSDTSADDTVDDIVVGRDDDRNGHQGGAVDGEDTH